MNTLVNVARYHLVDRLQYVVLPVGLTLFALLTNLAVFALLQEDQPNYTGGLLTLYIFMFICGTLSMTKSLPFGLALGMSRRTYYLGTIVLVVGLSALYAAGVTVLQAIESATGGWGINVNFFRVPWLLNGSWYLTLLTSFVLLVLMFVYGMWYGLVYRRWAVLGLSVFIAAQVLVLLTVVVVFTWTGTWPQLGRFLATLTSAGLSGVLAILIVLAGIGGFTTLRRITV